MANNIIFPKAEDFALRIVNLYKYLCVEKKECVLSKQVLRSGTSIGANLAESVFAQSDADFITKYRIALKEANETSYWLKLLFRSNHIEEAWYEDINGECKNIIGMLVSALKKLNGKEKNNRKR